MDAAVSQVLQRLEARMAQERERFRSGADVDVDQMMLAVGRDAGQFLNILAKTGRASSILEAGTSVGYSTVWLADAAAQNRGRVISTEQLPAKHLQARDNLAEAGLLRTTELHTGDALATIRRHAGPFDFALIDLWKDLYIPVFNTMAPKLAAGALVAADNMVYPESARPQARKYQTHVRGQPGFDSVLVPIGNGIELSRKRKQEGPLTPAMRGVLNRLEKRAVKEDQVRRSLNETDYRARLSEFMLPVGPESGRFLNMLVKLGGFTRILELGTSVGYSTLWLGDAVNATGGKIQTIDFSAGKLAEAAANLKQAGIRHRVELVTGKVLDTIAQLPGPFDFVLLDYNRGEFIACLDALWPKLAPGAVLAADNMIEPAATKPQADAYRAYVASKPGLQSVLVPIGNGIEITRKSE